MLKATLSATLRSWSSIHKQQIGYLGRSKLSHLWTHKAIYFTWQRRQGRRAEAVTRQKTGERNQKKELYQREFVYISWGWELKYPICSMHSAIHQVDFPQSQQYVLHMEISTKDFNVGSVSCSVNKREHGSSEWRIILKLTFVPFMCLCGCQSEI